MPWICRLKSDNRAAPSARVKSSTGPGVANAGLWGDQELFALLWRLEFDHEHFERLVGEVLREVLSGRVPVELSGPDGGFARAAVGERELHPTLRQDDGSAFRVRV